MNKLSKIIALCLCSTFFCVGNVFAQTAADSLLGTTAFFGYTIGSKFTRHHQVVDYFKLIAKNTPRTKLVSYGKTHEGRDLMVMFVSSAENIKNLEKIRQRNRSFTGLEPNDFPNEKPIPIVWLSYNVHGDEAVSTETALLVLETLALSNDKKINEWLDHVVVAIDPCLNPDGRDRYVNWYNQIASTTPNNNLDDAEHNQPFPGGRVTHYWIDPNRDWVWQTQIETRQRLKLYHQWYPQIHVDFHEMGINEPYFFAPAAAPMHEVITKWQMDFQQILGTNNAKYFDKNHWLYYTKENFDLLYPSYGDTYPTYNGAIGFTYEQGGSYWAGLSATMQNGDTITLKQRAEHHYTASLSTIEMGFNQRKELIDEFKTYFQNAQNPNHTYKAYIIKHNENNTKTVGALMDLLDKQNIKYHYAQNKNQALNNLFSFENNTNNASTQLNANDLIVSAYQPMSTMVKVLFEPQTSLQDTATYDITAWSLPYVYNLQCFASKEKIETDADMPVSKTTFDSPNNTDTNASNYAYVAQYKDINDARFLGQLFKKDIKVRISNKPFSIGSRQYEAGSLLINKADNKRIQNLDKTLQTIAQQQNISLLSTQTGFVSSGQDFGSAYYRLLKPKKIALIIGKGIDANDAGAIWQYFENDLDYPLTRLYTENLNRIELNDYQTLILVSGSYEKYTDKIMEYIKNGGKVVAIETAVSIFAQNENTTLHKNNKKDDKEDEEPIKDEQKLKPYASQERDFWSDVVAGSIYKIYLDHTHPLAYGLGTHLFVLKNNPTKYSYLNTQNIGIYKSDSHTAGFTGYKAKQNLQNSMAIGIEPIGKGKVIYLQDMPIFRGFWHGGKLLLANATLIDE